MLSIITAAIHLTDKDVLAIVDYFDRLRLRCDSFELVVQDSGSPDAVTEPLRQRDYIKLQSVRDSGIYDAWNRALQRTNGDRVTFLGIDDFPDMDWVVFASAQETPAERSVIACDVSIVDGQGTALGLYRNPHSGYLNTRANRFSHPGLVFSRRLFDANRFPDQYKIIGDLVFYAQFSDLQVVSHFNGVGVAMTLGGVSNSPAGTRRVLKEYLTAVVKRDAPLDVGFLAKRLVSSALSVSPWLYQAAQRFRWRREAQ